MLYRLLIGYIRLKIFSDLALKINNNFIYYQFDLNKILLNAVLMKTKWDDGIE